MKIPSSRSGEGRLHIFRKKQDMEQAINDNMPLSGVLLDGRLWVAYRPHFKNNAPDEWANDKDRPVSYTLRSAVNLQEVIMDDNDGELLHNLCWFAPLALQLVAGTRSFLTLDDLVSSVDQFLLFLPRMAAADEGYVNSYFVIGDKWTERISNGEFVKCPITREVFEEWLRNQVTN
jgi:hypothetical protein